MATSGSFYSSFGTNNAYRLVVEWKRNSTNIANNTSNVTITAYMQSTGSSYTINSSVTKNGTANIAGSVFNFTFSAALSGNQKKQIYTKTMDIYHNADGTRSFSISISGTIGITFSSGYVGTISASGTATLDTIPRTSSFTLNTTSGTIGSTQFTVTINRASTAFTHKVIYKFGTINYVGTTNATTSFSFTPSLGDCSQIPNSTSGTATIVVETYNGSTYIGSASKTITLTVPSSVVPTISSLGAEVVAAGADASYGYVKGKSKCQLSVWGATGSYGSTITSYKITGGGGTWTSWQFTTGLLTTVGTITYTATITDSRGRTSAPKSVSITVVDYNNPTINTFTAERCTSDGTLSQNGTYVRVNLNFSNSSSGGTARATLKYCEYGAYNADINCGTVTSGSTTIIGGGSLSIAKSYAIKVTVSDNLGSTSKEVTISPQFVLLDFKAGGQGMGIGKYASTDNQLEIGMKTVATEDIEFTNNEKGIKWSIDSDGAGIFFHSDGNGSTTCFLSIETNDDMNEHILFRHRGWEEGYINLFMIHPTDGVITYKHFRPSTNGTHDSGSSSFRWRTIYAVNALNTSDVTYKENITPINEYGIQTMSLDNENTINNDEITLSDMREFIKDECDLYKYNYKEQEHEEIGFIAQDIVETKVGRKLIIGEENVDGGYMYSQGTYMGIIVGALKEEINIRDKELEEQKQINKQMNEKINELEGILKELLDKLN